MEYATTCICMDGLGHFYLGGFTVSNQTQSFPLDDGRGIPCYYQGTIGGSSDGSIAKFDLINSTVIGINETVNKDNFSIFIYPNPTTADLNVHLKENMENANYKIVNALGKTISGGRLLEAINKIDTKNLASGIYFMEITSTKGRETLKFIKND